MSWPPLPGVFQSAAVHVLRDRGPAESNPPGLAVAPVPGLPPSHRHHVVAAPILRPWPLPGALQAPPWFPRPLPARAALSPGLPVGSAAARATSPGADNRPPAPCHSHYTLESFGPHPQYRRPGHINPAPATHCPEYAAAEPDPARGTREPTAPTLRVSFNRAAPTARCLSQPPVTRARLRQGNAALCYPPPGLLAICRVQALRFARTS